MIGQFFVLCASILGAWWLGYRHGRQVPHSESFEEGLRRGELVGVARLQRVYREGIEEGRRRERMVNRRAQA